MDSDLASYKDLYLSSARENLQGMIQALAGIESGSSGKEAIESIFVKSHTLKGQSMTMGHTGIAKTALAIERYMRLIREEQDTLTADAILAMRKATVGIEASLSAIATSDKELPMAEIITDLEVKLGVKV